MLLLAVCCASNENGLIILCYLTWLSSKVCSFQRLKWSKVLPLWKGLSQNPNLVNKVGKHGKSCNWEMWKHSLFVSGSVRSYFEQDKSFTIGNISSTSLTHVPPSFLECDCILSCPFNHKNSRFYSLWGKKMQFINQENRQHDGYFTFIDICHVP